MNGNRSFLENKIENPCFFCFPKGNLGVHGLQILFTRLLTYLSKSNSEAQTLAGGAFTSTTTNPVPIRPFRIYKKKDTDS